MPNPAGGSGRSPWPPLRRIVTHGYFETRVEEECIRAERFGQQFCLLRVRTSKEVLPQEFATRVANALRIVDVVSAYGPGEFDVLMTETSPSNAEVVRVRLQEVLADLNVKLWCVSFPTDGIRPEVLLEKLSLAGGAQAAEAVLGQGQAMKPLLELVTRVAPTMLNVLVLGETGAGKEVLARQVHLASPRAKKPLVSFNCAALTESLLESELFGHERGAFTGAVQAKEGLIESADGGTVLLDEVGEMPLSTQAKLLRVLEQREVLRVGAVRPRPVDVRFIAATNRDLEAESQTGRFRQDLYFRLNGVTLFLPPLRERLDELPALVDELSADIAKRMGLGQRPVMSLEALAMFRGYSWPGNIRELRNVLERAVVLSGGATIGPEHLPVEKLKTTFAPRFRMGAAPAVPVSQRPEADDSPSPPLATPGSLGRTADALIPADVRQAVSEAERRRILDALNACAGNQTAAAEMLGISRRTLINRLDLYGIARPRRPRQSRAEG